MVTNFKQSGLTAKEFLHRKNQVKRSTPGNWINEEFTWNDGPITYKGRIVIDRNFDYVNYGYAVCTNKKQVPVCFLNKVIKKQYRNNVVFWIPQYTLKELIDDYRRLNYSKQSAFEQASFQLKQDWERVVELLEQKWWAVDLILDIYFDNIKITTAYHCGVESDCPESFFLETFYDLADEERDHLSTKLILLKEKLVQWLNTSSH
jgi:hypothetical protein